MYKPMNHSKTACVMFTHTHAEEEFTALSKSFYSPSCTKTNPPLLQMSTLRFRDLKIPTQYHAVTCGKSPGKEPCLPAGSSISYPQSLINCGPDNIEWSINYRRQRSMSSESKHWPDIPLCSPVLRIAPKM